ncbi:MAG: transcription elongation factor GreA [bacterium]|nr:transcription elongation factor GreA [bacterium]
MGDVHELSQAAHDRLQGEFDHLTTVGRVDIARKIEAARELGDLSENGDYHAAKDEQGKMETRIAHLGALLRNSRIVAASNSETVSVGSVVTIAYEGDTADQERYLVGSIEERREGLEVISPTSPMGSAIIGASVGDTVSYQSPTGHSLSVQILDLEQ